jgi:hypothetical protein
MSDTKTQKEANKEKRDADAKVAWDEYQARQAAIDKNTERLRALRLAKEAKTAGEPSHPGEPKPPTRRVKRGR